MPARLHRVFRPPSPHPLFTSFLTCGELEKKPVLGLPCCKKDWHCKWPYPGVSPYEAQMSSFSLPSQTKKELVCIFPTCSHFTILRRGIIPWANMQIVATTVFAKQKGKLLHCLVSIPDTTDNSFLNLHFTSPHPRNITQQSRYYGRLKSMYIYETLLSDFVLFWGSHVRKTWPASVKYAPHMSLQRNSLKSLRQDFGSSFGNNLTLMSFQNEGPLPIFTFLPSSQVCECCWSLVSWWCQFEKKY